MSTSLRLSRRARKAFTVLQVLCGALVAGTLGMGIVQESSEGVSALSAWALYAPAVLGAIVLIVLSSWKGASRRALVSGTGENASALSADEREWLAALKRVE